jgi:hypothetical protein
LPGPNQSSSSKEAKNPKTGEKRSATQAKITEDDLEDMEIDQSCDQVRTKINRFIENGGMKVTEFQKEIDVSSNSYYSFMNQHGRDKGSGSMVYINAWRFFKAREMNGVPMPKKPKASTSSTKTSTPAKKTGDKDATPKTKIVPKRGEVVKADLDKISDITLPGENQGLVPVFDTCGDVRRKISAYLRRDGITQVDLVHALEQQLKAEPRKLDARGLARFRGQKGPIGGAKTPFFYAGYVFFEKLRIADGKEKSSLRKEMEEAWGSDGVNRNFDSNSRVLCRPNERPVIDKYGQGSIMHRERWV